MQDSGDGQESKKSADNDDELSTFRLFSTAKQEIEFSYDKGLVAFNRTHGGPAMQLLMPSEKMARKIEGLIRTQHGDIQDLVARVSPTQRHQWVVQLPIVLAEQRGLLPKGVTSENAQYKFVTGEIKTYVVVAYGCRFTSKFTPDMWRDDWDEGPQR